MKIWVMDAVSICMKNLNPNTGRGQISTGSSKGWWGYEDFPVAIIALPNIETLGENDLLGKEEESEKLAFG